MNICVSGIECLVQNLCEFTLWLFDKNLLYIFLIIMIILLIIIFCSMFKNGN